MLWLTYHPQPPLADVVEQFWLYEGVPPAHARERRLPSGTMELVISLRDETLRPDHKQSQQGD